MHHVTFSIEHRGCYATELSGRFPTFRIFLRESVPLAGRARDLICVRADRESRLKAIMGFLSTHGSVRSVELLDADKATGFFLVEGEAENSLIDVVTKHRGFRLTHTHAESGQEHWNVGVARKEQAKPMLQEIAKLGRLSVHSIARDAFPDPVLSAYQRRIIRAAIDSGYYTFPRGTSPSELAKRSGLAKSTVLEHLRKAEAKVILSQEAWI